jgi:hypothetical protein
MRWKLILPAVVVVAAAAIVLSSPRHLVLDKSCKVIGGVNRARAAVQGCSFWAKQLAILDSDLVFAREWPARAERIEADLNRAIAPTMAEADDSMEDLYRNHPELRPSPEEQRAEKLREMASAEEARGREREMREMMAKQVLWLEGLRPLVVTRVESCK